MGLCNAYDMLARVGVLKVLDNMADLPYTIESLGW